MKYNIPKEFKSLDFRLKVYKKLLGAIRSASKKECFNSVFICLHLADICYIQLRQISITGSSVGHNEFDIPLNKLLPELTKPKNTYNSWGNLGDYALRINILTKAIIKIKKKIEQRIKPVGANPAQSQL